MGAGSFQRGRAGGMWAPSGRAGGIWRALASGMRAFVGVSSRKKLDHGWPESITSQARSAQRCRMRSFSLHEAFVKQSRQHQARCSAQTGRCKLVCASCSTQVALRKLLGASCSAQVAPCKLVPASGSLQVALCKLLRASCSLQVALRKPLCASCSVQVALRKLLCASCSAQVALCKLHLATPARGPGRNRTRDPPVPGADALGTPCNDSLQWLLAMIPCNGSLQ